MLLNRNGDKRGHPRSPNVQDEYRAPKNWSGTDEIGASYGSNMIKVLAALEAYWENRNNTHIFQEQLLYNLWKVSNNWLELKNSKAQKDGASELLLRRKQEVEVLRDEALAKLEEVSPRVADAFQRYKVRKQHGTVAQPLKGLGNGYHLEREHYLHGQKTSGRDHFRLEGGLLTQV